jgi:hypothetical protein
MSEINREVSERFSNIEATQHGMIQQIKANHEDLAGRLAPLEEKSLAVGAASKHIAEMKREIADLRAHTELLQADKEAMAKLVVQISQGHAALSQLVKELGEVVQSLGITAKAERDKVAASLLIQSRTVDSILRHLGMVEAEKDEDEEAQDDFAAEGLPDDETVPLTENVSTLIEGEPAHICLHCVRGAYVGQQKVNCVKDNTIGNMYHTCEAFELKPTLTKG